MKVLACVLLAVMSLATAARARVWRTPESLWADAASKSPNAPRPHINYGQQLAQRKDIDGAIAEFVKAREVVGNLRGRQFSISLAAINTNLSIMFLMKGRKGEAMILADEAVAAWPEDGQSRINRGTVRLIAGDCYGASVDYRIAGIPAESLPPCQ